MTHFLRQLALVGWQCGDGALASAVLHQEPDPARVLSTVSGGPCAASVRRKFCYLMAMDHVGNVRIVVAGMPIRITWRIRGEVKAFSAFFQVSERVAAVCKVAPLTMRRAECGQPSQ